MATGNVLKGKRARKEETAAFLLPESENDVVAAVSRCLRTVGPRNDIQQQPSDRRSVTQHLHFKWPVDRRVLAAPRTPELLSSSLPMQHVDSA